MASFVQLRGLAAGTLQDANGNALAGRQVYVYLSGTTTQLAIFPNSDGSGTQLSQPVTTDSRGGVPGYVQAGQDVDVVDVLSGLLVQGPALAAKDILPSQVRFVPFIAPPSLKLASSAWLLNPNNQNFLTFGQYNTTAANGDWAAWPVELSPGTWRADFLGMYQNNTAIVTVEYSQDNGVTWTLIGSQDTYRAISAASLFGFGGIVIPKTALTQVRLRVNGKNGSSSAYYVVCSGMMWTRTGP